MCERLDEVDCSKSESFYDLNLELYGNHGAGYGIQPEAEFNQDELCEEEDEEECQTEKPSPAASKPSEEADSEDTTTPPPPPTTSTSYPTTSPTPQIIQFPSSSPETIAALLALHKAFTQSLQQHSTKDSKINPPKLTGFVETLNPIKSTQEAETFEIKSAPPLPPTRLPTQFPPKVQTQYSAPQSPPKTLYQSQPKPHFSSPPKPQFSSPPKPQFQNPPKPQFNSNPKPQFQSLPRPQFPSSPKPQYQSQPKPQFSAPQKPQYQNPPKPPPPPPPPLSLPPVSFPKPVQTSQSYGNTPFHHSFHINSQVSHFPDPNYDQYSDHDPQSSAQSQTEAPKQYDFNDYEDDYYDEKPHSSTITPYLLHQFKVNQVKNANQAKVSSSSNHGSFVREVSDPPHTKSFNVPSFRSVTTPGIAIITATSTTSSSSVKTSKPVQSAIKPQKESQISTGFGGSLLPQQIANDTELQDPPQSYDDYRESDVRYDPFYKDVPKIGRNKRSIETDRVTENSVSFVDYRTLVKLKDKVIESVFKNNSGKILRAILRQYCNDQVNSSDSLVSYCSNVNLSDLEEFHNKWKIVIPKGSSDFLYLVKTIQSSNEYQNSTSNILLLVNLPDEFKIIRDSILINLAKEHEVHKIIKTIDLNNVNSSIHHRFKRVRRYGPQVELEESIKNKLILNKVPLNAKESKLKRRKRQLTESDEAHDFEVGIPQENSRLRPKTRRRQQEVVIRRRPVPQIAQEPIDSSHDVVEHQPQVRIRQRRPTTRRKPPQQAADDNEHPPTVHVYQKSSQTQTPPPREPSIVPERTYQPVTAKQRGEGTRYHFSENSQPEKEDEDAQEGDGVEVSTTYPFNLKPGTRFSCDDKIKGGYYADVEAECYGYFICSQGVINGPLLKSHFWCGPTTKFNQRSRTCQVEANVACSVSERYYHLNKDILSLPDPDDDIKDSFEPSKVRS